jgi:hypothetical protein
MEFSKCARRHQVTKEYGSPPHPFFFRKGAAISVRPHANFDLSFESLDVDHGPFLLRLRRCSHRFERTTARAQLLVAAGAVVFDRQAEETPLWPPRQKM